MSNVDPNRKVRVALNGEGMVISAGDPTIKKLDKKYTELIRKGYIVKIVSYYEYSQLKWKLNE